MRIFPSDHKGSSSFKYGNLRWWGRYEWLPGPLRTEEVPSGYKMPGSGEGVWVLGGLCPGFVGTSAGSFAEFYLLKNLRFIPSDCNKDHSAFLSSFLTLHLFLSFCSRWPLRFSLFLVSVSLSMEGNVKKPLWMDLNCQCLDYNFAHLWEVPFAWNSTKRAPSQGWDTLGALAGDFHCPCSCFGRMRMWGEQRWNEEE